MLADYERMDSLRAAQKSASESANETHRLYLAGRESFIADLDATRTLTSTNRRSPRRKDKWRSIRSICSARSAAAGKTPTASAASKESPAVARK